MKIAKISFVAAIALTSINLFAADSLQDSLKNGTFQGEAKAFYFDRDDDGANKKGDILNFGVKLDYESASFHGFKLALGTQTSSAPGADDESRNAFAGDMDGSGTVLSVANLSYTFNKNTIKAGRQYIFMPILKTSRTRLIHQSFEGITASINEIPDTNVYGAYVNRFQDRTDGSGNIGEFEDLDGDYVYTVGLTNKSISNTTLSASYGEKDTSHSMYYLQADYKNKTDNFKYNLAGQYSATDYDNEVGDKVDSDLYGLKAGIAIGGFKTYVAFVDVQDGTNQFGVLGAGSKANLFTRTATEAGVYHESEQYAIDMNYTFENTKFTVGTRYINVDYADHDDADIHTYYFNYDFSGPLKGLSAKVTYEDKGLDEYDDDSTITDRNELRARLHYKF